MAEAFPQATFHVLVDTAYAGQHLLQNRPKNCQITARWIAHPALYSPVPHRQPSQKGRPRVRGQRLENVETLLAQPCPHVVLDVYGKHTTYRLASLLACFFATPGQLLQIVAAEPLSRAGHPQVQHRAVFYSTALDLSAAEIIVLYARRWSVEVAFHDAKGTLGAEDPQGTCRRTVERHTPLLMLFIVWWWCGSRTTASAAGSPHAGHGTAPSATRASPTCSRPCGKPPCAAASAAFLTTPACRGSFKNPFAPS